MHGLKAIVKICVNCDMLKKYNNDRKMHGIDKLGKVSIDNYMIIIFTYA